MKIALAFAALVMLGTAASAGQCGPAAGLAEYLAGGKWREQLMLEGLAANGVTMQLYVNPATGTWTLSFTTPDGKTACAMGAGRELKLAPPPGKPL